MANIRIRTTVKERDAIRREIKRLVDENLVGTGNRYFMAGKVVKKIEALRGTRGLPKVFSSTTVPYFFRQMLDEGEILIKQDNEGEAYLVTKENPDRTFESVKQAEEERAKAEDKINQGEIKMTHIPVVDKNDPKADEAFARLVENKIQKSVRNTREFKTALNRALMGEYDEDIESATGEDFLKVTERWTIRKIFSLELGDNYYKLWKEVFYIDDPHKYYFDVVNPTIYRRLAPQHEEGDKEWAERVSKAMNIAIVED